MSCSDSNARELSDEEARFAARLYELRDLGTALVHKAVGIPSHGLADRMTAASVVTLLGNPTDA